MKKLIIIGFLLLGLTLQGLAQDVVTPGMSGLQTRNALNTAFSELLGVVDTLNETIRVGGVQITANAAEVNILDGALVNVTELNRLVGIPGNIVTLLAGKENSLGNPGTTGYVLSSTAAGVRSWIAPGSGTAAGFKVDSLTNLSGEAAAYAGGEALPPHIPDAYTDDPYDLFPEIHAFAGDTSNYPVPDKIGDLFVNTATSKVYVSVSTSRGGWVILNIILPLFIFVRRRRRK